MKQTFQFLLTLLLAVFILAPSVHAQKKSKRKKGPSGKVVFYGVDFSQARFIGKEGFTDPPELQENFLPKWNHLIINEEEKYDVKKALNKSNLEYYFDVVTERNAAVDPEVLVTNSNHSISKEDVTKVVAGLGSEAHTSGLGAVIVVESFDKRSDIGTMWLTTFDIATLTVKKTQRMSAKARGFGIRNYWARTIFEVLEDAQKKF